MGYYYVFLMPDGTFRAEPVESSVKPWEADAVDCWIQHGDNPNDAIDRVRNR